MRKVLAKKTLLLLLFVAVMFSFTLFSNALSNTNSNLENMSQRIFDDADKLTDAEETQLMEHFNKIKSKYKIDVVYVLLGEDYPLYEDELKALADTMYAEGSFGVNSSRDTVMLMMSTSTRKYNMVSFGDKKFDKNLIKYQNKVIDGVIGELKDGKDNYLKAGMQFATLCARYGKIGFVGKFLSMFFTWYMPLIALVVAVILIAVVLSTHKGTIDVTERTYEKSGSYKINNRVDRFKYRNVTQSKRSSDNDSSSGGGGGGGGSSFGSGSY